MNLVSQYLRPEVVARLGSLELRARMVVEGFITGLHRSPFHGFSAEFSEHRAYRHGDDLKHIDWKIYGRTDRFYVKQFEEETNLRCLVAVDASASMRYASEGMMSKFDYASSIAASLMYLILRQRDAAGLAVYNIDGVSYLPPRSKMSYIQELLRTLSTTTPSKETGTATALHQIAERLSRRGLVIIISDLFDEVENILSSLRHFRHDRHDVLVMQVMDPREVDFKLGAASVFKDMETGEELTTQPQLLQRAYAQTVDEFCTQIRRGCFDQNIDYVRITTDTPFDVALTEYIASRARVRG